MSFAPWADIAGTTLKGRYTVIEQLRDYSAWFRGVDTQTSQEVFIEVFLCEDEYDREEFLQNVTLLSNVEHPHLMPLLDWECEKHVCVVHPFQVNGTLGTLIESGKVLSAAQVLVAGLEASRALESIHRNSMVHGNITPDRLVFSDESQIRLSGLGLPCDRSRRLNSAADALRQIRYLAPEQAKGAQSAASSDIYSLALVLQSAALGKHPDVGGSVTEGLELRANESLRFAEDWGLLGEVLTRCGSLSPDERPSAKELSQMLLEAARGLKRPESISVAKWEISPLQLAAIEEAPKQLDTASVQQLPAHQHLSQQDAAATKPNDLEHPENTAPVIDDVETTAVEAASTTQTPHIGATGSVVKLVVEGLETPIEIASADLVENTEAALEIIEPRAVEHDDYLDDDFFEPTAENTAELAGKPEHLSAEPTTEGHVAEAATPTAESTQHAAGVSSLEYVELLKAPTSPNDDSDLALSNKPAGESLTDAHSAAEFLAAEPQIAESQIPESENTESQIAEPQATQTGLSLVGTTSETDGETAVGASETLLTQIPVDVPQTSAQGNTQTRESGKGNATNSATNTPDSHTTHPSEALEITSELDTPTNGTAETTDTPSINDIDISDTTAQHSTTQLQDTPSSGATADIPARIDAPVVIDKTSTLQLDHDDEDFDGGNWWAPLLMITITSALLAGGIWMWINSGGLINRTVPNFIGTPVEEATQRVESFGWSVEHLEGRADGSQEGEVLSQYPEGGVELPPGGVVKLTASLGDELVEIPNDLAGLSVDQVTRRLQELGLGVGAISRVNNEDLPVDLVIGVDEPVRRVPRNSTVALNVSLGPKDRIVPTDLIGKTTADATAQLALIRLGTRERFVFNNEIEEGLVVSLNPGPGSPVPADSAIELVISKGPEPVIVPEIKGLSLAEARHELEALGLVFLDSEGTPGVPALGTRPPAGSIVDLGSEVIVVLGEDPDATDADGEEAATDS